jgi:hypothetical protein
MAWALLILLGLGAIAWIELSERRAKRRRGGPDDVG